jgi:prevent-host-death family protein
MDTRQGVEEFRKDLGKRVDEAHFTGAVTVVTKNGEPRAVLVPYDWYREAEGRRRSMILPPGAPVGADLDRSPTRFPSELPGGTATETGPDQPERLGSARLPSERLEN